MHAPCADPQTLLRKVRLIAGLSPTEFQQLVMRSEQRRFKDGTILFVEGEPCEGMYLIVQGAVQVFKASSSGREIQLALQEAPSSVAEIPVFDNGPYPASARAVGDVHSFFVSRSVFADLLRENPEMPLKILSVIGERMRKLVQVVHLVTFGGVRQRMAQMLLDLEAREGGSPFPLTQTQPEIAAALGTVREVVSRNMRRFQTEGLIRVEGSQVWLEDTAGLRAEAAAEIR